MEMDRYALRQFLEKQVGGNHAPRALSRSAIRSHMAMTSRCHVVRCIAARNGGMDVGVDEVRGSSLTHTPLLRLAGTRHGTAAAQNTGRSKIKVYASHSMRFERGKEPPWKPEAMYNRMDEVRAQPVDHYIKYNFICNK